RTGDPRRRRLRAVRRRVHRAAPSPRRLRRRYAPCLLPGDRRRGVRVAGRSARSATRLMPLLDGFDLPALARELGALGADGWLLYDFRSEEHTSELQSRGPLVCRLLLEKKK